MSITDRLRGAMDRIPEIRPEVLAVWVALGLAGALLLDEWARWLSVP